MDSRQKNYATLKRLSLKLGIDLFGVADIRGIKKEFSLSAKTIEKFDKAISLGLGLLTPVLDELIDKPTRLYFHHYRSINTCLDQLALTVASYIQKNKYLALPIPASQILDWQKQTAHLSHKEIGQLAGLGWIGRNNLLVNEAIGSQFRLVTILTNMPLKLDKPVKRDCKVCRRCIEVCPAGAIKENPQDFEHIKCFEKLKDFQRQHLVDQYVCGVCISACFGQEIPNHSSK